MPETHKPATSSKATRRDFLKGSTGALGFAMAGGLVAVADETLRTSSTATTGQSRIAKVTHAASQGCPPEIRAAFRGPCPSISTPFTREGDIDFNALRNLVDFLIDAKAKVLILTWGDSLYSILTDDEVAEVTKVVVQHVNKRAIVVAADQSWWTGKEVEFAKYCTQIGADLLMVLPPDWAASGTVDSLVEHYRAVAKHIPVMVVDNYLNARSIGFAMAIIKRLYDEVPGVIAMKDDIGGQLGRKATMLTHDRWAVIGSGKELHMNIYPYGADGVMSTHMTFKPEIAWRYWDAIEAGKLKEARAVLRDYEFPLFTFLATLEGGPDAGVHGLLEIYGIAKRFRRPPYHSLTDKEMQALTEFLRDKRLL